MPTLLHISDLHRTSSPRPSNEDLLAAIISDSKRWELEGIPMPDLIAISGDLIQGAKLAASDPDAEIDAQYREVGDFLNLLCAQFFDSDRSRIVVVPGNHDVNWNRALAGMKPINSCPEDIASKALEVASDIRWNWRDQQTYEIVDQRLYESRYEHFRRFQKEFYGELTPNPLLHAGGDLFFCEYPDLDLVVAGFPSWHGNDCFCHVGEIDSSLLTSSRKLRAKSEMTTAVAVWHHSITGGPRAHDYMDHRVVHRLIDFGFNVGLHGHQHFPEAAPFELHLPNLTSMAVIGAGSLAVGDNELPMGERRQFNIIVIDSDSETITVHVRGMSRAGVFTGFHREDFGGNTYIELALPASTHRTKRATALQHLDQAMTAIGSKRYDKALALSADIPSSHSTEKRRIALEALRGLGRKEELFLMLDPPQNVDEAVEVVSLLIEADRFDDATNKVDTLGSVLPFEIRADLTKTIEAKRLAK